MATLTETLRELAAKVDIRAAVNEALNPAPVPLADVAYIYNGYDDLELLHCGQYVYKLPYQQVTKVDSKLDHKEVDPGNSLPGNVAYKLYPMKGESIAREIIENRGFQDRGVFVFTDMKELPKIKEAADEIGTRFKQTEIERFKVGRDKARAGQGGYKLKPDPNIYRWMKQYNPDDEMFGDGSKKSEAASASAASFDKIANILERLTESSFSGVKRKPLESDEDYAARLMTVVDGLTKPKVEATKATK